MTDDIQVCGIPGVWFVSPGFCIQVRALWCLLYVKVPITQLKN